MPTKGKNGRKAMTRSQGTTGYGMLGKDPGGREVTQEGRASFSVVRMRDDWKIVGQHFSLGENGTE